MMVFLRKIFSKQSNFGEKELRAICPYCKEVLKQKPQRKKKCPFCNKDIYVRSKQEIFSSTLLTKEDAITVDCLKNLENIGIKIRDNDFKIKKRELSIKFGKEAKSSDVIWDLFNELILLKMKDLHSLKMIYYEMALFLNKLGKDCFAVLQQSAKMELMKLKQDSFIKKVRILTAGENSCEACRRLENQVFTIEEALEKMPIPCSECTHKLYDEKRGFCRCCYMAEIG